jgi:hypothetical protein
LLPTAEDVSLLYEFIARIKRRYERKHTWTIGRKVQFNMLKIDDHVRCPQCNERSRVVWVSQDGKQAAIKCQRHHSQIVRGHSMFGSTARPQTKPQKNMVFLVETEETAPTLAER